jgi:hypothetical protein
MITNDVLIDLLRRHVLQPGEQIERTKEWPGDIAVAVTTNQRYFRVKPDTSMLASQSPWVSGLVIATRGDLEYEGLPETDGILVLADGASVYLNDPAAVAELGRWLESDLDPVAFAEILVAWHPWTTAATEVIVEPDQVQRALDRSDLPTFEPPTISPIDGGLVLTFFSSMLHARDLGANTLLTVYEWTVLIPTGEPARWERRVVLDAVPARATTR